MYCQHIKATVDVSADLKITVGALRDEGVRVRHRFLDERDDALGHEHLRRTGLGREQTESDCPSMRLLYEITIRLQSILKNAALTNRLTSIHVEE